MIVRNTSPEDLPVLISIFGEDYMNSHKEEISLDKSIIYLNGENKVDVVILLKKSSLFDFFGGTIPDDNLYPDNIVADQATAYEYNHYEIINWYATDNDYLLLNSIYRQAQSINYFVLLWAQCKEYESFPIQGFYNFNDRVWLDIPDD